MLIQSRNGVIHLVPALPKSWKNGSFRGLRARGGFEVDAKWENGKIVSVLIKSVTGEGEVIVKANGREYPIVLRCGEEKTFTL